jgi:anti-sigma factor RsiW
MTPSDRTNSSPDPLPELDCVEVVELVTGYLEGSLEPGTAAAVAAHLATCSKCDTYLQQMVETIARLGTVPVDTLSEQAQADLVAAFRGHHPR